MAAKRFKEMQEDRREKKHSSLNLECMQDDEEEERKSTDSDISSDMDSEEAFSEDEKDLSEVPSNIVAVNMLRSKCESLCSLV